jgi:hypothetical protein
LITTKKQLKKKLGFEVEILSSKTNLNFCRRKKIPRNKNESNMNEIL